MDESLQGFLENRRFSGLFCNFGRVGSWYMDWKGVHWIELVEFYLWVSFIGFARVCGRIALHISRDIWFFRNVFFSIWDFSSVCKGARKKYIVHSIELVEFSSWSGSISFCSGCMNESLREIVESRSKISYVGNNSLCEARRNQPCINMNTE